MSIRAMVWALDTQVGNHLAKLILIALADNADDEKFQCWPSVSHLARRCEVGRSTVYRSIIHLERLGLVHHKKRRNVIGVPRQPLFTLRVPALVPIRDNIVPQVGRPNPTAGTSNEPSLNLHKERGVNGNSKKGHFKSMPHSPEFLSWKSHYVDTKQNAMVRELGKRELEGRPFDFESQRPPN